MTPKLSGKSFIVTGSSGGFGSVLSRRLCQDEATVVGFDKSPAAFEHENYLHMQIDLSDHNAIRDALDGTQEQIGGIFHCVAEQPLAAVGDNKSEDLWVRAYLVNVLSLETITSKISEKLSLNWPHKIISIGSVHESVTSSGMAPYSVSKAALAAWVRAAAIDLKRKGITTIGISVGAMDSAKLLEGLSRFPNPGMKKADLISRLPAGRIIPPNDLADLCIALLSDSMNHLVGSTIRFDGGAGVLLATE